MTSAEKEERLQSDLVVYSQKYLAYMDKLAKARNHHDVLLARNTAHKAKQNIKEILFQIYEMDLKKKLEIAQCQPTQN
jgi:hypothetical protein